MNKDTKILIKTLAKLNPKIQKKEGFLPGMQGALALENQSV